MYKIKRLINGGIIPIYKCPAACRHCLYGCSNEMGGAYASEEQSEKLVKKLFAMGCRSMHIGGGEPFLNFERLVALLKIMRENLLDVDYIETNAAWCTDNISDDEILTRLKKVKSLGGNCILISVDPYHIEFVKLKYPLRLIRLCEDAGLEYFVWKFEYLRSLVHLDHDKTYTRKELEAELGENYVYDTANSYGLSYNGRALQIAREYLNLRPIENFLASSPCASITSKGHFHADYNSYFIPPSCTGLGIPLDDLADITKEKYPAFFALANGGLKSLYSYAGEQGFSPNKNGYASKCDVCFDMRKFLLNKKPTADIYPIDYYNSDY